MSMRSLAVTSLLAVTLLAGLLAGCGRQERTTDRVRLDGAGATFPYPVYSKWASKYRSLAGTEINYQPIGSGGGIQQIRQRTVDFGASDAPMTKDELDEAGLVQFPMIVGGVVPVVNLEGVEAGELKLTPQLLADIYLGRLKMWNHPAIAAVNPGLNLPDRNITVVTRSDGSGTTWLFTNYLDKVSADWRKRVGCGKAVDWPTGVSFKGNDGVASQVQVVKGSIGYVEYAFVLENKMRHVKLRNRAGSFVEPSMKTFKAAAASADWTNAPGYYVVLTNQPGRESWPITGASYIIIHKAQSDATRARAMLDFFDWCYRHGSGLAEKLAYVPMPIGVIKLVEKRWADEIRADGKPVWR